ncbi:MAG: J domain-containing protein [Verrucomicrobiota bacterium]
MIPKKDQPWFEFHVVQPNGDEWVESLPSETVGEAMSKMRRVYPDARLTIKRHYKKSGDTAAGGGTRGFGQRTQRSSPPPKKAPTKRQDFRTVFGLDESADFSAVKKAYLQQIKRYHPDRVADMGPELVELAEKKTREFNAAFQEARKHFGQ